MAVNHVINTDWVELNLKAENLEIFGAANDIIKALRDDHFKDVVRDSKIKSGKSLPYMEGPAKIMLDKFILKRSGNGNKFYRDYYVIWHRGKKLGVMLCNSRDHRLMPLDNMQLQIANNKLYEVGWLDDLKLLMSKADLSYKSAVRLDIAVDGGEFFHLFEDWEAGKIEKVGRAKITKHMTGKGKLEGYYLGMSKSKKRLTAYNKSEELKRKNKLYIERFWQRSNLAIGDKVERLELRMKNEESKKFKDLSFDLLDNTSHLASIMRSNLEGFFEFVEPSKQKNISRKKRIEYINWDELAGTYLDKDSTRPSTDLWAAKVTMKQLYSIHYITAEHVYLDIAYEMACNTDTIEWFNKMQKHWEDDLKAKLGNNRDSVVSDSYLTRFKAYHLNEQILIFDKNEGR